MSKFHVIGISNEGKLDMLVNGDEKAIVLAKAAGHVGNYRQLFLVRDTYNAQELTYTPPAEGTWHEGAYSPVVQDLDLDFTPL